MMMSQEGSPSSTTPEEKNEEMTTSQGGSPSFATPEKKKQTTMSLLVCRHLLHLRKKNKKMMTN
jgi:hypothetical protein